MLEYTETLDKGEGCWTMVKNIEEGRNVSADSRKYSGGVPGAEG